MTRIEGIVERHYASVHRFLRALSGSVTLADDLAQETFAALARRGVSGIRQERSYVMRIAYTRWVRHLSTLSSTECTVAQLDVPDSGPTLDEAFETAESLQLLRFYLDRMPPELRVVLILVSLMDYSFVDAAEMLEAPRTTLIGRHRRALEWLRCNMMKATT
jgi:RNA polymerase sigma factor (sigma-70 family)